MNEKEFCFLLDLDIVNIMDMSEQQFNFVCIDAGCFNGGFRFLRLSLGQGVPWC